MYDPNQPRVPEGHHGGGRWTRGGYGYLSDVGAPRPSPHADDPPRAPDEWDREPDDLYLLSDLDRLPLRRSNPRASADNPQYAFVGPAAYFARKTIEAALTTFAGLSALNSPKRQAVIVFRSREFVTNDQGLIILEQVSDLDRETVLTKRFCPNLKKIEDLMDEVLKSTPPKPGETNSQYGTRIHKKLERELEENSDFDGMRAEVSFAVDEPNAQYGTGGSIRVDVIEDFGNGTACIYDYKLGKAVLRPGRMFDIAQKTFESQSAIPKEHPGKIRRIIMTEVRHKEQRQQRLPGQLLGGPRPSD
jgi:hypothetical protein